MHRQVTGQPRWGINNRLQSLKQGVASALTLLFFLFFLLFLLLRLPLCFFLLSLLLRDRPWRTGWTKHEEKVLACLRKPVGRIYREKRIINGERVHTRSVVVLSSWRFRWQRKGQNLFVDHWKSFAWLLNYKSIPATFSIATLSFFNVEYVKNT